MMAEGRDAADVYQSLKADGYGHAQVTLERWMVRLRAGEAFEIPGDVSLNEALSAQYPDRRKAVSCLRYDIPWWAEQAVRAYGQIQSGLLTLADLCPWTLSAVDLVGAEQARILRERAPKPDTHRGE